MFRRALPLFALLVATASTYAQTNILEIRSFFKPSVSFTQKYAETAFNDPDAGAHVAVPSGSYTVDISASLQSVDISSLTEDSTVGFVMGNLTDSHALSEDPSWKPGKKTAVFFLPGPPSDPEDPDSPPTVAGKITYTWTEKALTITAVGDTLDAGTVVDATMYEDGAVDDLITAEVTFGDAAGTHDVPVTGNRKTTVKHYGSGDEAEELDLVSATLSGTGHYGGPKLTLVSPGATLQTTTEALDVIITSEGTEVSVSLNGEDFAVVDQDSDTGKFLTTVTLVPGANHLEVQAADEDGNLSADGADIFYTLKTNLNVTVVGGGSVTTGFAGDSQRNLGAEVSITAKPDAGKIFAGWTGDYESSNELITFVVTENMSLTATFEDSPFAPVSGSYSSSFGSSDNTEAPEGALKVTVTSGGEFTGQVLIAGHTYTFTGQLLPDGTADVTVPTDATHDDLVIHLGVDPESTDGAVTGTVGYVGSDSTAEFTAAPPVSASHPLPAALVGRYTIILRAPAGPDVGLPGTVGFATLRITAGGHAVVTGKVNDGKSLVAFSLGATVDSDSVLRLYVPLYKKSKTRFGAISGPIDFTVEDEVATSSAGSLAFNVETVPKGSKPGVARTVVIDTGLELVGSRYVAPGKKDRAIPATTATLDITSEVSELALSKDLKLNVAGKGTVIGADPDKTKFKINPANGTFSGSFYSSDLKGKVPMVGVVDQIAGSGEGTFVLSKYFQSKKMTKLEYGTVMLTPVE